MSKSDPIEADTKVLGKSMPQTQMAPLTPLKRRIVDALAGRGDVSYTMPEIAMTDNPPHDYAELDGAILRLIKDGGCSFDRLRVSLDAKAKPFADSVSTARVIELRLQTLQRRKIVRYNWRDGRWVITQSAVAGAASNSAGGLTTGGMAGMKFITTIDESGTEEVFVFPRRIHHDAMAEALEGIRNQTYGQWERIYRKPVAAGFVDGSNRCHGRSETLNLAARERDTELLTRQRKPS